MKGEKPIRFGRVIPAFLNYPQICNMFSFLNEVSSTGSGLGKNLLPSIPPVPKFSKGFLYSVFFLAINLCTAQEAIQGVIPDWNFGEGDVITGFKEPRKIGTVSPDGNFTIPLTPNFIQKRKEEIDKNPPVSSADKTSPFMDLDRVFRRRGGSIVLDNAIQPVGSLSNVGVYGIGNMEGQELFGLLIAASSETFAESVLSMPSFEFTPGFLIDWYYVDKAATIKGVTTEESLGVDQKETFTNTMEYDLEFQPGWNMVKYEILSVFEDRDGRTYPRAERYISLTSLPEDFEFVFVPK
ncbi:MAG: hypothetical protein WBM56_00565 [Robiginitalea sp.]